LPDRLPHQARAAGEPQTPLTGLGRIQTVLTPVAGLSDADLTAVADLERRVVAHDGGRLKLEWGTLRSRTGEQIDDLLWWDGDRLVGFLGCYGFGSGGLELAGMVEPDLRRTGIGTALLLAAMPLARDRGFSGALLVTPRATPTGAAFASAHQATLEHSEHFLSLTATPTAGPLDPDVILREATTADADAIAHILTAGFGRPTTDLTVDSTAARRVMAIERSGRLVGTMRYERDGEAASIYGLAVDPVVQGQGIGRDALNLACRDLRAGGADRVTLEVASDNDRALELYLSVGFELQTTEDYFALPIR
jgi:ribosomal protein S18 acetylase RimI-like enzyme